MASSTTEVLQTGAVAPEPRRRARMAGVVAGLTATNAFAAALGFITGPLLARALGASGRGDLAAITVPLGLAPGILGLGIPAYAYRELPRGRAVGQVLGSLGAPLLAIGATVAVLSVPIADALSGGRPTVRVGLIVVFAAMPLFLLGSLLLSSLGALERWIGVAATTLTPYVVPFIGIVSLYVAGALTVASAAAVTLAGSLLALGPGVRLLVGQRPEFSLPIMRAGMSFGFKSWVGGLAQTLNGRLDQFLMITAVAPRVLGLYAVATTLASASGVVTAAISPPLMARVGGGEHGLMAMAVRIMLVTTIGLNLVLAAITPLLLPLLFGPEFRAAVPMALLLLAAQVPLTGSTVLSSGLQAAGHPLIPTVAECLSLVITVVGLAILLGPLGGIGAALVSVGSYSISFTFQVIAASRRINAPIRTFLLPGPRDLRWAAALVVEARDRLRAGT